jgi:excisionase family DNA binding protein
MSDHIPPSIEAKVLTVKQAAVRLGISTSLVYALCAEGAIHHTRHGRSGKRGCIRITAESVEEYRALSNGTGRLNTVPIPLKHLTVR